MGGVFLHSIRHYANNWARKVRLGNQRTKRGHPLKGAVSKVLEKGKNDFTLEIYLYNIVNPLASKYVPLKIPISQNDEFQRLNTQGLFWAGQKNSKKPKLLLII